MCVCVRACFSVRSVFVRACVCVCLYVCVCLCSMRVIVLRHSVRARVPYLHVCIDE